MSTPHWIETFCQHYATHANATAAFIAAHPRASNWKRRSACRKAVELMKRPDVQARITVLDRVMQEQSDAAFLAHLEEYFSAARRGRS
jgi:phage terminase small subunit